MSLPVSILIMLKSTIWTRQHAIERRISIDLHSIKPNMSFRLSPEVWVEVHLLCTQQCLSSTGFFVVFINITKMDGDTLIHPTNSTWGPLFPAGANFQITSWIHMNLLGLTTTVQNVGRPGWTHHFIHLNKYPLASVMSWSIEIRA